MAAACATELPATPIYLDLSVGDSSSSADLATTQDLALSVDGDAPDLGGVDFSTAQVRDFAAPAGDMVAASPAPDLAAPSDMTPRSDFAVACHGLQAACVQSSGCCQDGVACTYVDGNPMCCQPLGQACSSLADCCFPSGVSGVTCNSGTCCALSYITTGCPAGKHKVCAECPEGIVNCASSCT